MDEFEDDDEFEDGAFEGGAGFARGAGGHDDGEGEWRAAARREFGREARRVAQLLRQQGLDDDWGAAKKWTHGFGEVGAADRIAEWFAAGWVTNESQAVVDAYTAAETPEVAAARLARHGLTAEAVITARNPYYPLGDHELCLLDLLDEAMATTPWDRAIGLGRLHPETREPLVPIPDAREVEARMILGGLLVLLEGTTQAQVAAVLAETWTIADRGIL